MRKSAGRLRMAATPCSGRTHSLPSHLQAFDQHVAGGDGIPFASAEELEQHHLLGLGEAGAHVCQRHAPDAKLQGETVAEAP